MDFTGQEKPGLGQLLLGFCSLPIRIDPLQAGYKPGTLPGMESKPGIRKPGMARTPEI